MHSGIQYSAQESYNPSSFFLADLLANCETQASLRAVNSSITALNQGLCHSRCLQLLSISDNEKEVHTIISSCFSLSTNFSFWKALWLHKSWKAYVYIIVLQLCFCCCYQCCCCAGLCGISRVDTGLHLVSVQSRWERWDELPLAWQCQLRNSKQMFRQIWNGEDKRLGSLLSGSVLALPM